MDKKVIIIGVIGAALLLINPFIFVILAAVSCLIWVRKTCPSTSS